jgi:hypothetical protein
MLSLDAGKGQKNTGKPTENQLEFPLAAEIQSNN